MPYCCRCGNHVGDRDRFCRACGAEQPQAATAGFAASQDYLHGINPRTASLLCYIPVIGWIAAIVVLASARFRADARVRFNAFQGLYIFVAWLIVDWAVSPLFGYGRFYMGPAHLVPALLKALVLGAWIFMIIKASQNEFYKLPILGDLAEKSVSEQRP